MAKHSKAEANGKGTPLKCDEQRTAAASRIQKAFRAVHERRQRGYRLQQQFTEVIASTLEVQSVAKINEKIKIEMKNEIEK